MNILRLISVLLLPLGFAASADATGGGGYWIANVGQWEGDFQFKCEVGSTIYYVTPYGLTIDFRSYVGADGNPPAPSGFDNFAERGFSEVLEKHAAVPRRNLEIKGHVIQIHYSRDPRRQVSSPAPPTEIAIGENKLPHYSNYFLGRDSTKWRSRVSHYQNIIVPEVWPGIDVEYRADKLGVETIYHVKPGADPTQIQMEYLGLDAPLHVDAQGNLILTTSLGEVKEKAPFAFQKEARMQKRVDAGFQVIDETRAGYDVGAFDAGKELVVDPLIYSTFFANGEVDYVESIALDAEGNIVVSGTTDNLNFPTTPGVYAEEPIGEFSYGYISKLNSAGSELIFSSYFVSSASTMLVAQDTSIWWATTAGNGFPITENAVDTVIENSDVGLIHLSPDGSELLFASFFGGASLDQEVELEMSANGLIYLLGSTWSMDLFTTPDAIGPEAPPGVKTFLTILDPFDYTVHYSTYLPTTADVSNTRPYGMALLDVGRVWITANTHTNGLPVTEGALEEEFEETPGHERSTSYFCLLNTVAGQIEYGSYWGNADGGWYDELRSVIPISDSEIILCGSERQASHDFPPGGFMEEPSTQGISTFVVRFQLPDVITHGTYIGGIGGSVYVTKAATLPDGSLVLSGLTSAEDFPVTPDAFDSTFGGGPEFFEIDGAIARLSADLSSLEYGSFVGGSEYDYMTGMAVHGNGCWLGGWTQSPNFHVTPDAMFPNWFASQRGFLTKFEFIPNETPQPGVWPVVQSLGVTAFPNPFNPTTTLEFTLPSTSNAELTVLDILGREVMHENLGRLTAGQHEIHINGSEWSSGIYFATLKTPAQSQTTKLLLLR